MLSIDCSCCIFMLVQVVFALQAWDVVDYPQYSSTPWDAKIGSPYKLVVGCLSADQCCQLLRDLYLMQNEARALESTSLPTRAKDDPIVESVHNAMSENYIISASNGERAYAVGTEAKDFEQVVVGTFSCRDTLPWRENQSPLDKMDEVASWEYDYLWLKNGATEKDKTIYLPRNEVKYRYNYFFRCPKGYRLSWDPRKQYHYGGWTDVLLSWSRVRRTRRDRRTLWCNPNVDFWLDMAQVQMHNRHIATLWRDNQRCIEGTTPKPEKGATSMAIELKARIESDDHNPVWIPSQRASITEKGAKMVINLPGDLGTAWSRVVPMTQQPKIYTACLSVSRLPNKQKETKGTMSITFKPVLI